AQSAQLAALRAAAPPVTQAPAAARHRTSCALPRGAEISPRFGAVRLGIFATPMPGTGRTKGGFFMRAFRRGVRGQGEDRASPLDLGGAFRRRMGIGSLLAGYAGQVALAGLHHRSERLRGP